MPIQGNEVKEEDSPPATTRTVMAACAAHTASAACAASAAKAVSTAEAAEQTMQEFIKSVFRSQHEHGTMMTQSALLLQESREALRRMNRLLWEELD